MLQSDSNIYWAISVDIRICSNVYLRNFSYLVCCSFCCFILLAFYERFLNINIQYIYIDTHYTKILKKAICRTCVNTANSFTYCTQINSLYVPRCAVHIKVEVFTKMSKFCFLFFCLFFGLLSLWSLLCTFKWPQKALWPLFGWLDITRIYIDFTVCLCMQGWSNMLTKSTISYICWGM